MLNFCFAEARKLTRHHALMGFTLGLPFAWLTFFTIISMLVYATVAEDRVTLDRFWVISVLEPWSWLTAGSFPLGRFFPLIFMAAACGTEYQSGMWKNVLLGQSRTQIIVAKCLTLVAFAWGAFFLLSLFNLLADSLVMAAAGKTDFWVSVNGNGLKDFFAHWPVASGGGLLMLLILACLALLAAVWARSTFGALVAGFMFIIFESLVGAAGFILSSLFGNPDLRMLAQLTPTYNITNLQHWLEYSQGFSLVSDNSLIPFSFTVSLLIVVAWIVGLGGLAVWKFQTQDIVQ